ncbi:pr90 [rat cytomegalovirus strain Maastricht]|uniref:Pr90 n=1 Tax=Rat cytomegalovirus (strain Maastricht) TaxID=79700 RepID=Q9DWB2_RCMVM|nr:pr90 [rat cytomegalovirus strain Maastricht]AAF99178.1 pr90 [rat cytomegalovirus strain Maastricht]WEG72011.1 envelope protein m90 [Murid betaherpesvirus 2]
MTFMLAPPMLLLLVCAARGRGPGGPSPGGAGFALNVTVVKGEAGPGARPAGDPTAEKVRRAFRPVLSLWFRAESGRKFDRVRFLLTCNGTHGAVHMYSPPTTRALSASARNGSDQLVVQAFSRRQCAARAIRLVVTELYGPLRALFREACEVYGASDDSESSTVTKDRGSSNDPYALSSVFVLFMICLAVSFLVCVWALASELKKRATEERDLEGRAGTRTGGARGTTGPAASRVRETAAVPPPPPTAAESSTSDSTARLLR